AVMVRWLGIVFRTLRSSVRTHRELALENLALRQQLAVWKARQPRPRLSVMDRMFWVLLSRLWTSWRHSLQLVRPETVVGWHRQGFRRYWAWKSRSRHGRPRISSEVRALIRRMSYANPLWGAPRMHGELLKLGLRVSQATMSKYMLRDRKPPSQAWRAFLKNHAKDLIALDLFTVPTATFRVLFVLVMLTPSRRRLVHFNVTEHPTAEWTAHQLLEACGREEGPRYLIRDRDQVYGERFSRQAKALDLREAVIAPRSPWQKRVCRASDRLDTTRMCRPCRGDWRAASDANPDEVRRVLQRDPDTLIAGQGRAQVADCATAERGQGDGGATRGWASSRIHSESGMNGRDE